MGLRPLHPSQARPPHQDQLLQAGLMKPCQLHPSQARPPHQDQPWQAPQNPKPTSMSSCALWVWTPCLALASRWHFLCLLPHLLPSLHMQLLPKKSVVRTQTQQLLDRLLCQVSPRHAMYGLIPCWSLSHLLKGAVCLTEARLLLLIPPCYLATA
jgi:hypothetical protein